MPTRIDAPWRLIDEAVYLGSLAYASVVLSADKLPPGFLYYNPHHFVVGSAAAFAAYDPGRKLVFISFAGTDDLGDFWTDITTVASSAYVEEYAAQFADWVIDVLSYFPNYGVVFTGHSLGGMVAETFTHWYQGARGGNIYGVSFGGTGINGNWQNAPSEHFFHITHSQDFIGKYKIDSHIGPTLYLDDPETGAALDPFEPHYRARYVRQVDEISNSPIAPYISFAEPVLFLRNLVSQDITSELRYGAVFGGGGNDKIRATSEGLLADGGGGHDQLYGGNYDDILSGGEGLDALWGFGGADALYGGNGDDVLTGGSGSDHLYGASGASDMAQFEESQENYRAGYDPETQAFLVIHKTTGIVDYLYEVELLKFGSGSPISTAVFAAAPPPPPSPPSPSPPPPSPPPPPPPAPSDDYGNNAATAFPISSNTAFAAKIETLGDLDWFKLSLQAGTRYNFSMTGGSVGGMSGLTAPHMYFYDANGVLIGDAGPNLILTASVGTTGTYYIVAGAHLNSGIGGYALAVTPSGTFTPGPPPPSPPPPIGTAPPKLDLDSVQPDMPEDEDSIIFKVEYSGTLTGDVVIGWSVTGRGDHPTDAIDFVRTSGTVTLHDWDDEVYIRLSPNEDKVDEFDETFRIKIWVVSGNATVSDDEGDGTIINDDAGRIHPDVDELNTSFATATWVPEDTWARGFVTTFGDVDYFAFTLTGGATYDLIVIGDNDTSLIDGTESGFIRLSDPQASLYNQNFQLITGQFNAPINSSRISYQFTPATTGVYYVAVREDGHNDVGQYFIQADVRIPADDYAASTATTGRLTEGALTPGYNERDGDDDWFAVTLVAGETYSFYAIDKGSASFDGSGYDWPGFGNDVRISLRNASGVVLKVGEPNPSYAVSSVVPHFMFTAPQSGTYYLSVTDIDGSSGRYLAGYDQIVAPPLGTPKVLQPGPQAGVDVTFLQVRDHFDGVGVDSATLTVGGTVSVGSSGSLLKFDTTALPEEASFAAVELYFTGTELNGNTALAALSMVLGTPVGGWNESSLWGAIEDYVFKSFLPAPGAPGWYRIDITDLYNAWQDGTLANNGIILLPAEMRTPASHFYSSDYSDPALRPRLVVYERTPGVVQGSTAFDILTGSDHADRIFGLAGDDLIAARGGADWIDGGIGADIIDGGDGYDIVSYASSQSAVFIDLANNQHNGGSAEGDSLLNIEIIEGSTFADTLIGSLFVDTLLGGDGNDVLWGREGDDRLDGGPGTDWFSGGPGNDSYYVDSSGDFIVEGANEGTNDLIYTRVSYTLAAGVYVEILSTVSDAGTDPLTLAGNELDNRIIGNAGANILYGMGGIDTLEGLAGDDRYIVDNWNDLVVEAAGQGYDAVFSAAHYRLAAGSEVEVLSALDRLGTNLLDLAGNEFGNALYGNAGANQLGGGAGNDWLEGGDGNDRLAGGADNDTASYVSAGAAVTVSLALPGTAQNTGGAGIDTLEEVENLVGSAFGDTLTGNGLANVLDGRGGADTMRGGAGDDTYYVDNAGDTVVELAGEGFDLICTTLPAYSLVGTQIERLGSSSDIAHEFRGNGADNHVSGGGGNDVLLLHDGGSDWAVGGGGNDVLYFGAAFGGADIADGGAGRDALVLQGNVNAAFGAANLVGIESLSLQSGANAKFGDTANNFYDFNITMADGNVTAGQQLIVNASSLRAGEDFTFNGSAELDGRFLVYGGHGVDILRGGAGNDIFFFEGQRWGPNDRVDGGAGRDALVIAGTGGLNQITFGADSFTSVESISLNSLLASDPSQKPSYQLVLNNGNVAPGATLIVNGSSIAAGQVVNIDGRAVQSGALILFGGGGHDVLIGGGGADLIVGGSGADALTGGAGADVFRYDAASDSVAGLADLIGDFQSGLDRIDLSRIDANSGVAGDQAFSWIGSAAFSGVAGQLRSYDNGGYRWIEGDTNGDGAADLVIALTPGGAPLGQADFLL